jgi:tRNA pseudouridine55 synthase
MDGIFLFNKPILWTSHDAVDFMRRKCGQKSVGHAGTLDPMATGLLVILMGKATKLSSQLSGLDKDYSGVMTLGLTTDTQDLEGKILLTADYDDIDEKRLESVFSSFRGEITQVVPLYSAVRQNGRKLYDLARRGTALAEMPQKTVQVSRFTMTRFAPPDVSFFLTCSKGTYVRSICDDAGRRLGCGAVLSALVRTRVGAFSLENALDAADIKRFSIEELEKRLTFR